LLWASAATGAQGRENQDDRPEPDADEAKDEETQACRPLVGSPGGVENAGGSRDKPEKLSGIDEHALVVGVAENASDVGREGHGNSEGERDAEQDAQPQRGAVSLLK